MNSKKCFSLFKMRGIGLLELMLSLSIIAILLIMATRYYLVTSFSQKITQGTSQVTQLQAAVYSWKGTKTSYAGLTNQGLIDIGKIAQGDLSGNDILNPWGKQITIQPSSTKGNGYAEIRIPMSATDEEKKACANLVNSFNVDPNTASCETGSFLFTFQ